MNEEITSSMNEETSAYLFGRKFTDKYGKSVESFTIRENLTLMQACVVLPIYIIQSPSHSFLTPTSIYAFAQTHDGKFYFRDDTHTFIMTSLPSVDSFHDMIDSFSQHTPPSKRPSKIDLEVDLSFDQSFD